MRRRSLALRRRHAARAQTLAVLGVDDYVNRTYVVCKATSAPGGRPLHRLLRQPAARGGDPLAAELPAGLRLAAGVVAARRRSTRRARRCRSIATSSRRGSSARSSSTGIRGAAASSPTNTLNKFWLMVDQATAAPQQRRRWSASSRRCAGTDDRALRFRVRLRRPIRAARSIRAFPRTAMTIRDPHRRLPAYGGRPLPERLPPQPRQERRAGGCLCRAQPYKEAIIEYRRALQVAPRRADIHYKLAKLRRGRRPALGV